MKIYTKIHKDIKAALSHVNKIAKRGGIGLGWEVESGVLVEYFFPIDKRKNKSGEKKYDVISPEGLTIRVPDYPLFNSIEERDRYFKFWKSGYEKQGYYPSVNHGRISLIQLHNYCQWFVV